MYDFTRTPKATEFMFDQSIFEVWFRQGFSPDHDLQIATFFDREAATEFCRIENDVVQADMLNIEERVLISDHGFHCSPAQFYK